jgi:hypothetical protein
MERRGFLGAILVALAGCGRKNGITAPGLINAVTTWADTPACLVGRLAEAYRTFDSQALASIWAIGYTVQDDSDVAYGRPVRRMQREDSLESFARLANAEDRGDAELLLLGQGDIEMLDDTTCRLSGLSTVLRIPSQRVSVRKNVVAVARRTADGWRLETEHYSPVQA